MSKADENRWNQRYREERRYSFETPRSFLVQHVGLLPRRGLALDAAMGLGGNAAFLLERGLRVIGVDISRVAVRQAKASWPAMQAVVADLTHFCLPAGRFDVIMNFYYLQRDLWPQYRTALRPGGILVMETLTRDFQAIQPDIDPKYLLEEGELLRAFHDWEVLAYAEGWHVDDRGHSRPVASLVARKPYH